MRRRLGLVIATGFGIFGLTAVAVASHGNRPQTDSVMALQTYTHIEGKFRECEGRDGPYLQQRFTVTGTSTGDPRLAGDVEVRIQRDLLNLATGFGTFHARLVIRDSSTGRKKVAGEWQAVTAQDISQGLLRGEVRDEGVVSGRGELFANIRTRFHPNGAVTSQIGGVTDGRNPAVIQSGRCTGRWERFEADIPRP
jgi:hypothetical protein